MKRGRDYGCIGRANRRNRLQGAFLGGFHRAASVKTRVRGRYGRRPDGCPPKARTPVAGHPPATICYTSITPGCLVRLCLHGAFGSRGTPSAAATNQNFPITTFVASMTAWLPLCLGRP